MEIVLRKTDALIPYIYNPRDRTQTTVLNFDKPSRNKEHPTMKPIALFDYQIQNDTKSEDIVLDTFAGSGTTIMACEQNGRSACCMARSTLMLPSTDGRNLPEKKRSKSLRYR